jgi:hypothetical protein
MRNPTVVLTAMMFALAVGVTGCNHDPTAATIEPSIDPSHPPDVAQGPSAQVRVIAPSVSVAKKRPPAPGQAIPHPRCDIKMLYGAPNPC